MNPTPQPDGTQKYKGKSFHVIIWRVSSGYRGNFHGQLHIPLFACALRGNTDMLGRPAPRDVNTLKKKKKEEAGGDDRSLSKR